MARSLRRPGNAPFQAVADRYPDTDEATFVDAVGRNLRSGRFLLLVAGDGIREGTEAIVQFMQEHSGMRFTFGLVEMAGYEMPDGSLLVQPRILARTIALERTVLRVVETASPLTIGDTSGAEDDDAEDGVEGVPPTLRRRDPALAEADRAFWHRLARTAKFDDPSQPPPRRRGLGHARYDLGVPDVWITAYRARSSGLVGIYADFRGEVGARMYSMFEAERPEINAILRASSPEGELEWGESPPASRWVAMRLRMPGTWLPEDDTRHLAWLAAVGNAFINVFRPRVHRIAADPS